MKVADLSIGEIMQLPDCAFGRQWQIKLGLDAIVGKTFGESIDSLPERAVVWGVYVSATKTGGGEMVVTFALGEQAVANEAEFDALERLFPSWRAGDGTAGAIDQAGGGNQLMLPMRLPVLSSSRRLHCRVVLGGAVAVTVDVGLLVSSFPTGEVLQCWR